MLPELIAQWIAIIQNPKTPEREREQYLSNLDVLVKECSKVLNQYFDYSKGKIKRR